MSDDDLQELLDRCQRLLQDVPSQEINHGHTVKERWYQGLRIYYDETIKATMVNDAPTLERPLFSAIGRMFRHWAHEGGHIDTWAGKGGHSDSTCTRGDEALERLRKLMILDDLAGV